MSHKPRKKTRRTGFGKNGAILIVPVPSTVVLKWDGEKCRWTAVQIPLDKTPPTSQ